MKKKFLKFNGFDQRPFLYELMTPKVDLILARLLFEKLNFHGLIYAAIEKEFRYGRQEKEKFRQSN